jgi:putative hemolysin
LPVSRRTPISPQYQTIAGFLLQQFGTIPNVGEHVEAHGWRFEIVDLDGRRIDKVLATKTDNPNV